jgi:hypothetical protein
MSAIETTAEAIRMRADKARLRDERERDAARAVIDEEKRRKATAAKTVRLRELRLAKEAVESARDAAVREVAAATVLSPVKRARRKSAVAAVSAPDGDKG